MVHSWLVRVGSCHDSRILYLSPGVHSPSSRGGNDFLSSSKRVLALSLHSTMVSNAGFHDAAHLKVKQLQYLLLSLLYHIAYQHPCGFGCIGRGEKGRKEGGNTTHRDSRDLIYVSATGKV